MDSDRASCTLIGQGTTLLREVECLLFKGSVRVAWIALLQLHFQQDAAPRGTGRLHWSRHRHKRAAHQACLQMQPHIAALSPSQSLPGSLAPCRTYGALQNSATPDIALFQMHQADKTDSCELEKSAEHIAELIGACMLGNSGRCCIVLDLHT